MLKSKEDNRVLSRLNARELSAAELDRVSAGFIIKSGGCTFNPVTCTMDHDCEPPLGC